MTLTRSKYCLKSFAEENELVNLINELLEESNSAAFDMSQCRQTGHVAICPYSLRDGVNDGSLQNCHTQSLILYPHFFSIIISCLSGVIPRDVGSSILPLQQIVHILKY